MVGRFLARLSLLSRFTLISFGGTLLIAALLAWGLERNLENDVLWEVAENAASQATNVLAPALAPEDFEGPLPAARYQRIDQLVHETLLKMPIVRIKLWNRTGLLLYSDDAAAVGQSFPLSTELAAALAGQLATEVSDLTEPEDADEQGLFAYLFEIYVPLRSPDGTEILGAYQVYYDYQALVPRLARLRYLVWGGVGSGFLLLYAAVFLLIRGASRDLIQKNLENQRLLLAEQKQRERAESLERVSRALSESLELRRLLELICRESAELFRTDAALLWLLDGGELVGFSAYGPGSERFIGLRYPIYDPHLLGARVARERKSILIHAAAHSDFVDRQITEMFQIQAIMGVPLLKGERLLGALMIVDAHDPARFSDDDLQTATIFGSHAALAIENAQLFERSSLHLEHERALREIDLAITSRPDLELNLRVVTYQTCRQLEVDACAILLLDPASATLRFRSGQGIAADLLEQAPIKMGVGRVGQSVQEQRVFGRAEIEALRQVPDRAEVLQAENFVAYFVAPLVTKGKLLGALEIYHRSPLKVNTEWLKFLETLAGQAAIAVENATMFHDLQRSNEELAQAYEAAIEGWARALELRDKETEGHTRRVTEMTVRLAEAMNLEAELIRSMRRGAMLHDIGKMGIPDAILRKAAKLTPQETEIMRQHPAYAHELLKDISYLRNDLDIPYCHHEKWDGSGYPRGLRGEAIPLAARVFAVADVFDALTADRPYRNGWSARTTLEYICAESGSHFDPQVVKAFRELIEPGLDDPRRA